VDSVVELGQRLGVETITGGAEAVDQLWPRRRSMLEHLAATADGWWVAEQDGRLAGYARSVLRDGVRELTEFFVRPGAQSAGLGRELLDRAFAAAGARARILLATPDTRALIRYLKAGLVAACPVFHFHRAPRRLPPVPGLNADRLTMSQETLDRLAAVDREVLGFRRDPEHRWLFSDRQGWWYSLNGRPLGYGYVGSYSGPFAALDPSGFGAMLSHAESVAPSANFGVDTPLINRAALDYLLPAGYRMDPFANYFMSDRPIGSFDRYLVSTPSVFL
jgi:GNAT superfamily N-acetyltransferase